MERKKILVGLEDIAAYYGRSKKTVKELAKTDNFPAIKVHGRWESNTDLIDAYQCSMIERGCRTAGQSN